MLQDVIDIKIIIDNNSYSNLYFHCKNEIDLQHSNNQDRLGCLYVSTTLQDINLMEIPSISDVYALNGIRIKFLVTKAIIKQSNSLFLLSSNIFTILSFLCQFFYFIFTIMFQLTLLLALLSLFAPAVAYIQPCITGFQLMMLAAKLYSMLLSQDFSLAISA